MGDLVFKGHSEIQTETKLILVRKPLMDTNVKVRVLSAWRR